MNIITLSIILGLIALVPMGLGSAISPLATKKIGVFSVMLWRNIMTSILLLGVLIVLREPINLNWGMISFTLLISSLTFAALIFYLQGFAVTKVGVVSPVASFYVVISLTLSVFFFKTPIGPKEGVLIGLILLGVFLMSFKVNDWKNSAIFDRSSGVLYGLGTAISWCLFFFLAQIPIKELGAFFTAFLFEFGMLIFSIIYFVVKKIKPVKLRFGIGRIIFLVAFLNVISILGFYKGLEIGNVGIVLALASATPLVICLYGRFVYKEKLSLTQYFAIFLILIGIVSLSV